MSGTSAGADSFDSGCSNALRTFQDAYAYKEIPIVGMVYGSAAAAGKIRSNKEVMQEAFDRDINANYLPRIIPGHATTHEALLLCGEDKRTHPVCQGVFRPCPHEIRPRGN